MINIGPDFLAKIKVITYKNKYNTASRVKVIAFFCIFLIFFVNIILAEMEKMISPLLLHHLKNTNSTIKLHTDYHPCRIIIYITTDSKKFYKA